MSRKKVFIGIGVVSSLCCFCVFVLFQARQLVASEGYDTNEAMWNYVFRDGEIRIRLREGSEVKSYDAEGSSFTSGDEVGMKVGYGVFHSKLSYVNNEGEEKCVDFRTDKFNSWNKVLYIEMEDGSFERFDNGVKQDFEYKNP